MNTREREQWIDNDEGLYNWWRSSRLSKREFIRQHRDELDQAIDNALHPCRPDCYACRSGVGTHTFRR